MLALQYIAQHLVDSGRHNASQIRELYSRHRDQKKSRKRTEAKRFAQRKLGGEEHHQPGDSHATQ